MLQFDSLLLRRWDAAMEGGFFRFQLRSLMKVRKPGKIGYLSIVSLMACCHLFLIIFSLLMIILILFIFAWWMSFTNLVALCLSTLLLSPSLSISHFSLSFLSHWVLLVFWFSCCWQHNPERGTLKRQSASIMKLREPFNPNKFNFNKIREGEVRRVQSFSFSHFSWIALCCWFYPSNSCDSIQYQAFVDCRSFFLWFKSCLSVWRWFSELCMRLQWNLGLGCVQGDAAGDAVKCCSTFFFHSSHAVRCVGVLWVVTW